MRWFLVIAAVALAVTGSASAELVARVPDGMIAVTPTGKPLVGFVRGHDLVIAERTGRERWTQQRVTRDLVRWEQILKAANIKAE